MRLINHRLPTIHRPQLIRLSTALLSPSMAQTKLVMVGAVACDVILGVPFFPEEDSKLRATSFHKRRGGNVGNTLEVLQQLFEAQSSPRTEVQGQGQGSEVDLALVAALPAKDSIDTEFISSSFAGSAESGHVVRAPVDMSHCLYRHQHSEPVTSFIISSAQTHSRTIVNHMPLPEMTLDEFKRIADSMFTQGAQPERFWFHFEGRIPTITVACMQYLKSHPRLRDSLTISVELEKPGRPGLQELVCEADVVFYSRSWAEGEGYTNAPEFLRTQSSKLQTITGTHLPRGDKLLVCTWGACGASGSVLGAEDIVHSPALHASGAQVVDSTGAGDTFIAGALYKLLQLENLASVATSKGLYNERLQELLDFANHLAGRKIMQGGFSGLGVHAGSFAASSSR